MRIGVLTKRYYTNQDLIAGRYGRWFHLPIELAKLGAEVKVFCPDVRGREAFERTIGGVDFESLPSCVAGAFFSSKSLRAYQPDVWIASGNVFAARHVSSLARNQSAGRWVFDLYDYYPAFVPVLLRWWGRRELRRLLSHSHGCIAASSRLQEIAAALSSRVARIPNGVDRRLFRPRSREACRTALKIGRSGDFLVGIFGSLRDELGLSDSLAAIAQLRARGRSIELLGAGKCSDPAVFSGDGNRWLGMLPQEKLADWASACDVVLVPYRNSLQVAYSNSCRLAEFLALQVPLVATRTGDALAFVGEDFPGLCEPGDPSSLASAIGRQLDSPRLVPFPEELDWESLGKKTFAFLSAIMQPTQQATT